MNLQLFGNGGDREKELRNAMLESLTKTTNGLASTLYTHTWKTRTTPDGNQIISLRASARRTSGNGFTSWPTPQANNAERGGSEQRATNPERSNDLHDFALLASWPTPMAGTPAQNGNNEAGNTDSSRKMVELTSWATPSSRDWKDSPGMATTGTNPDGTERERLDQLPRQANLAAWPTPSAQITEAKPEPPIIGARKPTDPQIGLADVAVHLASWPTPTEALGTSGQTSRSGERKDELLMGGMVQPSPEGPARLTASGVMLTGSDAGMDGGGQLNPALPRWLQALPVEWDMAAIGISNHLLLHQKKKRGAKSAASSAR